MNFKLGDMAVVVSAPLYPTFVGQVVQIIEVGPPNYVSWYDAHYFQYRVVLPWGFKSWCMGKHLRPLNDPDAGKADVAHEELDLDVETHA